MDKKGALFFTLDTLLAGIILTTTAILVLSVYTTTPIIEDPYHYIMDYTEFITNTKMQDFTNPAPKYTSIYFILDEPESDLSIIQKVYSLSYNNETENETINQLVNNITQFIMPRHINVKYEIHNYTYERKNYDLEEGKTVITMPILTYFYDNQTDTIQTNTTKITIWS